MTLSFLFVFACIPADLGGNEDTLGQPRSLLANCVQDAGGEGLSFRYDSDGYLAFGEWPDGSVNFQERTILDDVGRPVVTERSTPAVGLVSHIEQSYLEESWKLDTVREVSSGRETLSEYSWARGGFMVQDGSECFHYVDLAVGIRPSTTQVFCDGEQTAVTRYTWRDDRLVALERVSASDASLRSRYTYDAQGRLSSEQAEQDLDANGVFEDSVVTDFTWDCQS